MNIKRKQEGLLSLTENPDFFSDYKQLDFNNKNQVSEFCNDWPLTLEEFNYVSNYHLNELEYGPYALSDKAIQVIYKLICFNPTINKIINNEKATFDEMLPDIIQENKQYCHILNRAINLSKENGRPIALAYLKHMDGKVEINNFGEDLALTINSTTTQSEIRKLISGYNWKKYKFLRKSLKKSSRFTISIENNRIKILFPTVINTQADARVEISKIWNKKIIPLQKTLNNTAKKIRAARDFNKVYRVLYLNQKKVLTRNIAKSVYGDSISDNQRIVKYIKKSQIELKILT